MCKVERVILIVLDGVGVGNAPDAVAYGDEGSNTLGNLARAVGGLSLPNLQRLGLGNIISIGGVPPRADCTGCFGAMRSLSAGKDTTTGHWEIAGVITERPFPTYPQGFPPEVIRAFEKLIGRETLGNYPASGTEIIEVLGREHMQTGKPIVYTSGDSVFQIAAHEEIIPVPELYRMSLAARNLLVGEHNVGRVIARPFIGKPGAFTRTDRRKDFSVEPPNPTILDALSAAGLQVVGIGKISDVFTGRGLTAGSHITGNLDGITQTVKAIRQPGRGLIFTNLVDFDSLYGHRNNPAGFATTLREFDDHVPEILHAMRDDDILIITADHGNDPTTPSTDHSREQVPLLVFGKSAKSGVNLGVRGSFANIAATISAVFGLPEWPIGADFSHDLFGG